MANIVEYHIKHLKRGRHMKKLSALRTSIFASIVLLTSSFYSNAALLLQVDLSVEDRFTINTTGGLSEATASGSNFFGVLLTDFFSSAFSLNDVLISGDLSTSEQTSDGSPNLFSFSDDFGLNIFDFANGPNISVTEGEQAFTGSATFSVNSSTYLSALQGAANGDIFFGVDSLSDVLRGDGTFIGSWSKSNVAEVASPSVASLMMFSLIFFAIRSSVKKTKENHK